MAELDPQIFGAVIQFFKDTCEGDVLYGKEGTYWFKVEFGGEFYKVGLEIKSMTDGLWDLATMKIVRKTYDNGN